MLWTWVFVRGPVFMQTAHCRHLTTNSSKTRRSSEYIWWVYTRFDKWPDFQDNVVVKVRRRNYLQKNKRKKGEKHSFVRRLMFLDRFRGCFANIQVKYKIHAIICLVNFRLFAKINIYYKGLSQNKSLQGSRIGVALSGFILTSRGRQ